MLSALGLLLGAQPVSADTAPITYSINGIVGTNGWFRGSSGGDYVVVNWTVNVQATSTSGCEAAVRIDGPSTGTTRTCSATLSDGTQISVTTKPIKVDADPPTGLTATPSRAADANGWYNHPLDVAWSAGDATSGIANCTSVAYPGPDAAPASVSGGCTDLAGNSASSSFGFQYDATPPQLKSVSVQSGVDANTVHWKSTSPTDVAVVSRSARGTRSVRSLFDGASAGFVDKKIRDGIEYRYLVRTYDQAGNASQVRTVLALPKVVPLWKVGYTPRAAARPILSWPARRGASYYHVQLFRNGKRILAAWPLKTQLALPAHWRWAGHRYRLAPARYAWYAWAGLGARKAARYKLLGHSTFIVPAR